MCLDFQNGQCVSKKNKVHGREWLKIGHMLHIKKNKMLNDNKKHRQQFQGLVLL